MTDIKMTAKRVAELEGAQLDWAVAKALGWRATRTECGLTCIRMDGEIMHVESMNFRPSFMWECGGPIVEALVHSDQFEIRPWNISGYPVIVSNSTSEGMPVKPSNWSQPTIDAFGQDTLTAACRAFAMWKLGDVVEVPE